MPVFSTLRQTCRILAPNLISKRNPKLGSILKRDSGHGGTFEIKGSTWNDTKAQDLFYLYSCVAGIIYGSIILYTNIFIGPATLVEIPEGYKPKHWEYYEHPIARFLQRYCYDDPQMNHETFLHDLYEEDELMKIRKLDDEVDRVMKRKKDYKAYYYRPVNAEWVRREAKETEFSIYGMAGDSLITKAYPVDIKDETGFLEREFKSNFPDIASANDSTS